MLSVMTICVTIRQSDSTKKKSMLSSVGPHRCHVGNAVAHGEVLFLRVADGRVFAATGPAARVIILITILSTTIFVRGITTQALAAFAAGIR